MKSALNYLNYKDFLQERLIFKKKKVSSNFTFEKMATAAGVQKTYLSRALNGDTAHLSEDQLYGAATYLGVTETEHLHLQNLRTYEKSSLRGLKNLLAAPIKKAISTATASEAHITSQTLESSADQTDYYLDPNFPIIHMLLCLPNYKNSLRKISDILGISNDRLNAILSKLEEMSIIGLTDDGYVVLQKEIHLSSNSPLYSSYRVMQRIKSIERMQKIPIPNSYHFSAAFSSTESTKNIIQLKFLQLLQEIEALTKASADEEVYQLNFDLFDWSIQH